MKAVNEAYLCYIYTSLLDGEILIMQTERGTL